MTPVTFTATSGEKVTIVAEHVRWWVSAGGEGLGVATAIHMDGAAQWVACSPAQVEEAFMRALSAKRVMR